MKKRSTSAELSYLTLHAPVLISYEIYKTSGTLLRIKYKKAFSPYSTHW